MSKTSHPGREPAPPSAQGSTDQSIGRPGPWREGRYEQSGGRVDRSVITPGGAAAAFHDNVSTPVTREDYEGPGEAKGLEKRGEAEGPNDEHDAASRSGHRQALGKNGERHR
jgi:hypothetical protein